MCDVFFDGPEYMKSGSDELKITDKMKELLRKLEAKEGDI